MKSFWNSVQAKYPSETDVLAKEKNDIIDYVNSRTVNNSTKIFLPRESKNAEISKKARKEGNLLYVKKNHDEIIHEEIYQWYTRAIRYAPCKSDELACGYGNRSALLFHLNKHKECLEDCDQALKFGKFKKLLSKWLCRKAESSIILDRTKGRDVYAQTLQEFELMSLTETSKKQFEAKIENIVFNYLEMEDAPQEEEEEKKEKDSEKNQIYESILKFPRHENIPGVSQSVEVRLNDQWGRHVVAAKDIRPGEIIIEETNFCTVNFDDQLYMHCSHCYKFTLNSLPCDNCVNHVYCGKECKSKSTAYHPRECPIYHLLWDLDKSGKLNLALRLFLKFEHDSGGLDSIQDILKELQSCKGCSDGLFNDQEIKNFFNLPRKINKQFKDYLIQMSCTVVYLLAKYTDFFGSQSKELVDQDFIVDQKIFFSTALISRILSLLPNNTIRFGKYDERLNKTISHGITLPGFASFINHDCYSNAEHFVTNNNQIVIYAKYPIKKGSQVFINYLNYSNKSYEWQFKKDKKQRQRKLLDNNNFVCNCTACSETWSTICLPSITELIETTPSLLDTLIEKSDQDETRRQHLMADLKAMQNGECISYSPESMEYAAHYLEILAEVFTVYCKEYEDLSDYIRCLIKDALTASNYQIPKQCFKSVDS